MLEPAVPDPFDGIRLWDVQRAITNPGSGLCRYSFVTWSRSVRSTPIILDGSGREFSSPVAERVLLSTGGRDPSLQPMVPVPLAVTLTVGRFPTATINSGPC